MALLAHARPAAASADDADVDADSDPALADAGASVDAEDDVAVDADIDGTGGSADDETGGASGAGGTSGAGGISGDGCVVPPSDAGRDGGSDAPLVNPSPNYPDDGCSMATSPVSGGVRWFGASLVSLALAGLALLLARR